MLWIFPVFSSFQCIIGVRHAARVPPPPSRRFVAFSCWRFGRCKLWVAVVLLGFCFLRGRVSVILYLFYVIINFLQKFRVGRNLRDELQQNITKNVTWGVHKSTKVIEM